MLTMTVQVRIVSTSKTDLKFALTIPLRSEIIFVEREKSMLKILTAAVLTLSLALRIRQRRQLANVMVRLRPVARNQPSTLRYTMTRPSEIGFPVSDGLFAT